MRKSDQNNEYLFEYFKIINFRKALLIPIKLMPIHNFFIVLHKLISVIMMSVNVLCMSWFINSALDYFNNGSELRNVYIPFLSLIAIKAYSGIFDPLLELLEKYRDMKLQKILRILYTQKRVRLKYYYIENSSSWDLISRTCENPEKKLLEALKSVLNMLQVILVSISYSAILLLNAPLAGALIIVFAIPAFVLAFKGGQASYDAERVLSKKKRKYLNIADILTSREAANERTLFGYTDVMNQMYYDEYEDARKYQFRVQARWFIRSKSVSLAFVGIVVLAIITLLPSLLGGKITIGLFVSLTGALLSIVNWMSWTIPENFQNIARSMEYIKDLRTFFTYEETEGATDLPVNYPFDFRYLEFRNVSFSYPGTQQKILDGISFKIEAGKNYSFVGPNGAGKTTVTKLMTCLYDNYEGEIFLNGKELRTYELKEIKSCFVSVFQDFAKYDITLAENVALGKANGALDEDIDHAVKLAGLSDRITHLKNGKNTMLGKARENGIDLSGGEWQRIAMARAIISLNPVKILDEPTAALDPIAESEMYSQFKEISNGLTTIFISHRLASATLADEIFVIVDGKVIEEGSHNDLMNKEGIYAEMFNSQRSWYM